ncbi:sensor histidine kinase [Actinomadura sp. KC345]|uniref:sensor histidine kinase n=1 Tax=Actinomadura sp. KC345 TaxID=2530371 RepID=UPI00104FA78B|nr:nitrate- and nitrite sensing domain-containing protein [Actinomadura sp. KC345]TDC57789.1 sensor histidine kinase [Actinomadura sp. KC345]
MEPVSSRGDAPQDPTAKNGRRRRRFRRADGRSGGRRPRPVRTRSIRTKVAALLLVPLLSLVVLWGYAANVTGRDALAQRNYHTLDRKFAPSGQGVLVELGKERQASAVFLSTPRAKAPATPNSLVLQRGRVDDAVARFRREATSAEARDATTAAMEERVDDVLTSLGGLTGLRSAVDGRSVERLTAIQNYSTMVDDMHRLYDGLVVIDNADLYNWTLSTRHAGRAMELLQRENALIASALVTGGRMTAAEHRLFVEMVGEQRWQWVKQRSLLDPEVYATGTAQVFSSPVYQGFRGIEDRIADADPRTPLPVRGDEWQRAAQQLVSMVNTMVLSNSQRAGERADELGRAAYIRLGAVGGLGLLAVLASVLLSLRFGRGFVRELVGLRGSAEELADRRLPALVDRLSRNEGVDVGAETPPLDTGRTTEVARLAESFSKVQRTAVDAAVGQAELRAGVSRIFLNIARRNQSLLHRQLAMLDALESRAEPDDLEDLFRIDHLTTRMRRHAESLIILSGATPGRGWRHPVRFADVLRAAVSEIEDYTRVTVLTESEDGLVGPAVTDVIHLLAELLDNAATFSPPNTEVRLMAERVGVGFAIEVEDRGLGVKAERLDEANRRLAEPPDYDLVDTDQLGLFVVARLAARHDVTVSLQRSPYGGVTAIVLLPHELVVPAEHMAAAMLPPASEPGLDDESGPGEQGPGEHVPGEHGRDRRGAGAPAAAGGGAPGDREPALVPAPRGEAVVPLRETETTGRFASLPAREPHRRRRGAEGGAGRPEAPPALPQLAGPAAPWGPPGSAAPGDPPGPAPNPWSDEAVPVAEPAPPEPFGPAGVDVGEVVDADEVIDADEIVDADVAEDPHEDWQPAVTRAQLAGTHAGLPRRKRQESLAPQLRKRPPPSPPRVSEGASGDIARSPEEARSLMASIQQGWRRGRATDVGDHAGDTRGDSVGDEETR